MSGSASLCQLVGFGGEIFSCVLASGRVIANNFYYQLQTGQQNRLKTRYMENFVKGNPVDLFPTNKIYFSYDSAGNFINGKGWGKNDGGFGLHSSYADSGLARRYFLGSYGNGEDISGLASFVSSLGNVNNGAFYPGFFDSNIGTELPTPSFSPVISGIYNDGGGTANLSGGWLALGYNGIGELKRNFSCFTPMFVQQPMNTTFCKIGQPPTFRALAVDYHTIPEDKINIRHPEIVYWAKKLKFIDTGYKNLYPLSYKWYRISKSGCSNDFNNFLLNPDFEALTASNPTGEWCALEGDGPYCTLIHPTGCINGDGTVGFKPTAAWDYKYRNTPMYETAKKNNFYMKELKGAVKGQDDAYYYFCMARGRFGVRISEPSELFIENWVKFDLSVQNGGNSSIAPEVVFEANDGKSVSFSPITIPPYGGFVHDLDSVPEDIVEEQIPPPNRGYGDVYSYKFVGMWGWRGDAQTYTPGTLNETRGLKETWGRLLHYGQLVKYEKTLTQEQGEFLYGRSHLPVCNNHEMPSKQDGVRVVVKGMIHWANMQYPIVYTGGTEGSSAGIAVRWDALGNAGEMYVPSTSTTNAGQVTVSPGIGQRQWGNNLGTIHLFGWNTKQSLLTQTPSELSPDNYLKLKKKLVGGDILAGENCGWHKNGLGRNMSYWIEGFNSFYIYCDNLKKKNVSNYNYMNPGLRQTNSSMQYFWLGKPNNSYLDRYPLFGPYAFHWKVRRHNRDRNGNGVSEALYSYGWNTNYTLQYDSPAIYGLFMKYKASPKDIEGLRKKRASVFNADVQSVKKTRFGFTNGDGGAYRYGDVWLGNKSELPDDGAAGYFQAGESFAISPQFNLYGCSDQDLLAGKCFDPCLSMRYQLGFLPGGKKQEMANSFPDGAGYRIVPNNIVKGNSVVLSTDKLDGETTYFRGAFGTPHLQYLKSHIGKALSSQELNGFSPCFDGGAEHCNFITATLNVGSSMYMEGGASNFLSNANQAAQSVNL